MYHILTRNSFETNNKFSSSTCIAGCSCTTLHIAIASCSDKWSIWLYKQQIMKNYYTHWVHLLIEDANSITFICICSSDTSGSDLVELKYIGILIPRTKISSSVKVGYSYQHKYFIYECMKSELTSHFGTTTNTRNSPKWMIDKRR